MINYRFVGLGQPSHLPHTGSLLGVMPDGEWSSRNIQLTGNERIYLYTDAELMPVTMKRFVATPCASWPCFHTTLVRIEREGHEKH